MSHHAWVFIMPRYLSKRNERFIHKKTCIYVFITVIFVKSKTRSNSDLHQQDNDKQTMYSHMIEY